MAEYDAEEAAGRPPSLRRRWLVAAALGAVVVGAGLVQLVVLQSTWESSKEVVWTQEALQRHQCRQVIFDATVAAAALLANGSAAAAAAAAADGGGASAAPLLQAQAAALATFGAEPGAAALSLIHI